MIPTHIRKAVLDGLAAAAGPDGSIPSSTWEWAAGHAKVSIRQVRRVWASEQVARRTAVSGTGQLDFALPSSFTISDDHKAVIASHGNLKSAWLELRGVDPSMVSYSQFCRATQKQIDTGVRAALLGDGAKALQSRQLYLQRELSGRNVLWEMDAQEIPVRVIAARGRLIKPWQTSVIDSGTRAILATIITEGRPNQLIVRACLAKAMLGATSLMPDGRQVFLGGVPEMVLVDNGGEMTGEVIQEFAARHAFSMQTTNPYAGWEKGCIESWHRTIQEQLYAKMPGFTHGPLTFTGTAVWDPSKSSEGRSQLLPFELLVEQTLDWIDEYNLTRPHSQLDGGSTPAQVWLADPRPVQTISRDLLVDDFLPAPKATYRIDKCGIRFRGINWLATEALPFVGMRATLRYLPQLRPEDDFVAVYVNDTFVGYGTGATRMSELQRRTLMRDRAQQYNSWRAAVKAGERLRARRADEALRGGTAPAPLTDLGRYDEDEVTDAILDAFAPQNLDDIEGTAS